MPDWSDGCAEAWFLPDAVDIPGGYATVGTWHEYFAARAATAGLTWSAGPVVSRYPVSQVPSTLWYDDHVLGMTRVNVYLPAALPLRDVLLAPAERADLVVDFSRMPLGLHGHSPQRWPGLTLRRRRVPTGRSPHHRQGHAVPGGPASAGQASRTPARHPTSS